MLSTSAGHSDLHTANALDDILQGGTSDSYQGLGNVPQASLFNVFDGEHKVQVDDGYISSEHKFINPHRRRVRKQEREVFSKDLNAIFYAPTQGTARAAFFIPKQQRGRLFPSPLQIIEKDLDSLLTFFQFDPVRISSSVDAGQRHID